MSPYQVLGKSLLILALLMCVDGCSTEQTVLRCANGPNASGTGCAPSGQTSGSGTGLDSGDGLDGVEGNDGSTSGLSDTWTGAPDDVLGS